MTVFRRLADKVLTRGTSATRITITIAAIGAATVATAVALSHSSGAGPAATHPAATHPAATHPAGIPRYPRPTASARQAARRQPAEAGMSLVATVKQTAPRFASPGRGRDGTVPASWYGRPSVLPVIGTVPGWVKVRLAQRPNESVAWLPAKDVTISSTPFRIVIDLATTHLELYDQGRLTLSVPAGVGTPDDPTPTGEFFVAFDEQPPQPNPGYGPFIMVTSAHSGAISDWEGSGDAVIGIHGPLGEDTEIGTTGARISHGCIRLHDTALVRLSEVPPGTPIDIVR
jgi:lipoprotein-anchoring transpeptidase ErfK/SrfK